MSTDPSSLRVAPPGHAPASGDPTGTGASNRVDDAAPTTSMPASDPSDRPSQPSQSQPGQSQSGQSPRRRTPGDPADRNGGRRPPPRRKRKVRKVHRVVRHIEVWSIAKLATAFAACGYVVGIISGYLLWRAADRVGTIDGIEGFLEDSGSYETFDILGDVVFKVAAVVGVVLALGTVALVVLGALLFNLISDLTGGIRMTVIDEDLIVAPARRPETSTARRPPDQGGAARRPDGRPTGPPARRDDGDPAGSER